MAALDWSQCPAVESVPDRVGGAWVFRGTRLPVVPVIENLEDLSVDEVIEPTTLPDGMVIDLVADDEGDGLTDEERKALHDALSAYEENTPKTSS